MDKQTNKKYQKNRKEIFFQTCFLFFTCNLFILLMFIWYSFFALSIYSYKCHKQTNKQNTNKQKNKQTNRQAKKQSMQASKQTNKKPLSRQTVNEQRKTNNWTKNKQGNKQSMQANKQTLSRKNRSRDKYFWARSTAGSCS